MTDEQIVKALECCSVSVVQEDCFYNFYYCLCD